MRHPAAGLTMAESEGSAALHAEITQLRHRLTGHRGREDAGRQRREGRTWSRYNKTFVALIGVLIAVLNAVAEVVGNGELTGQDHGFILVTIGIALGVYAIPNTPPAGELAPAVEGTPDEPDPALVALIDARIAHARAQARRRTSKPPVDGEAHTRESGRRQE